MIGGLENNTADSDADRKGTVTTLGYEPEHCGGSNQPDKKCHSFFRAFQNNLNHKRIAFGERKKKHSQLLDIVQLDAITGECIRILPYK